MNANDRANYKANQLPGSRCPVSGTTPPERYGGWSYGDYDGGFYHCRCGTIVEWIGEPWLGGKVGSHSIP